MAALLLSSAAWADGTDAGTVIENTATLSYSVGGAPQADITSAVADFKVDHKVDLTVTGNSATNVIVSPSTARLTTGNKLSYVLKNEGNLKQEFKLKVQHLGSDQFDAGAGTTTSPLAPEGCKYTVGGTDYDFTNSASVVLAKDATTTIDVTCSMPNRPDVNDGDLSTIDVLAVAVDGAGNTMVESAGADQEDVVDIVLADGEGTATDGAERNAMHSDTQTYEIDVPMLSVVKKSAVIADPVNCPMASPLDPTANPLDPNNIPLCTGNPKRIPGAIVEYSITVYNDSTTAATGVTMTDVLTAAEVDFIAGSIVNTSGTAQAYAAGTRTVTASGITVPAKSGATQGQAVVKFRVLIL